MSDISLWIFPQKGRDIHLDIPYKKVNGKSHRYPFGYALKKADIKRSSYPGKDLFRKGQGIPQKRTREGQDIYMDIICKKVTEP